MCVFCPHAIGWFYLGYVSRVVNRDSCLNCFMLAEAWSHLTYILTRFGMCSLQWDSQPQGQGGGTSFWIYPFLQFCVENQKWKRWSQEMQTFLFLDLQTLENGSHKRFVVKIAPLLRKTPQNRFHIPKHVNTLRATCSIFLSSVCSSSFIKLVHVLSYVLLYKIYIFCFWFFHLFLFAAARIVQQSYGCFVGDDGTDR